MKKGFTLIEMLGIITVLAVILLVTFPNVSQSIKQMKINNKNNFTNNLKVSAETYVELNRDRYEELNTPGGTITITIQDLYDANLLKGKYEDVDQNSTLTITTGDDYVLKYYYEGKQIGIE